VEEKRKSTLCNRKQNMTTVDDPRTTELKSDRVSLRRRPDRGHYDHDSIAAILDETFLCHIGFSVGDQPFVIPTSFGRENQTIFIHGSSASRMLREVSKGFPICVTVMLLDGIVLARSAFNHSMNYRSAVILGTAKGVEGERKMHALEVMANHMIPGRWAESRYPNGTEMLATTVLSVDISEASAKIRKGPPLDDDEDLGHQCWAGVLPVSTRMGSPIVDPRSPNPIAEPSYVSQLRGMRSWNEST
jgi:uncharacterized protein